MRLTIKQTLKHLTAILNGRNRTEMIRNLERDIEQHTEEAEKYKADDSYHIRMRPVHKLQRDYRDMTGKYYRYGDYKNPISELERRTI